MHGGGERERERELLLNGEQCGKKSLEFPPLRM